MQFYSNNEVLFTLKFRKKYLFLLLLIFSVTTDYICQTKTLTTTIAVSSRSLSVASKAGNSISKNQPQDSKCTNKTVSECAAHLFSLEATAGATRTTPMPLQSATPSSQAIRYFGQVQSIGARASDATYKALSNGYKHLQHDPDLFEEQTKMILSDANSNTFLPNSHSSTNIYTTNAVLFGDRTSPPRFATTTKPTVRANQQHPVVPLPTTAAARINVRWPASDYVSLTPDTEEQRMNNQSTYGHRNSELPSINLGSHIDEYIFPTTTTSAPPPPTTLIMATSTKLSRSSVPVPAPGKNKISSNSQIATTTNSSAMERIQKSAELYSIISDALRAIHQLNDNYGSNGSLQLNRTTRLVHEGDYEHGDEPQVNTRQTPKSPTTGEIKVKLGDNEKSRLTRAEGGTTSSELADLNGRYVTKEDVHLLCKLLHNQLESGNLTLNDNVNKTTTGGVEWLSQSPSTTSTTTTTTTTTTVRPHRPNQDTEHLVHNLNDLNEDYANRLIETVLVMDRPRGQPQHEQQQVDEIGVRVMTELYNEAARYGGEYDGSEPIGPKKDSATSRQESNMYVMRLWSKAVTPVRGQQPGKISQRLRLVYWLLERHVPNVTTEAPAPTRAVRYRVLSAKEAGDLIDRLDHEYFRQKFGLYSLRPIVLIAASNETGKPGDDRPLLPEPTVIDDRLSSGNDQHSVPKTKPAGSGEQAESGKTALRLLIDKLTSLSFWDNLHLYLILFLIALLIIILCFAVPMMCAKCQVQKQRRRMQTATSAKRPKRRRRNGNGSSAASNLPATIGTISEGKYNQHSAMQHQPRPQTLSPSDAAADAIWRKLSDSTTTLIRDQLHVMRNEGMVDAKLEQQVNGNQLLQPHAPAGGLQWYSFSEQEDGGRRSVNGRQLQQRQSKDVGTGAEHPSQQYSVTTSRSVRLEDEQNRDQPLLQLEFSDRQETRCSNTLTKSELVMLKEKLVPITSRQQQPDYVNQAIQQQQQLLRSSASSTVGCGGAGQSSGTSDGTMALDRDASNYLDASASGGLPTGRGASMASARSDPQGSEERRPKMRHVELPVRTKGQVAAIRDELERLERADAAMQQQQLQQQQQQQSEHSGNSGATYRREEDVI